ncbi:hypothetical protein BDF20DRAFT_835793 [Mycotypha africana]|uniref:uncharacterized protein n=1 Tax=Mycotypha africana TaxID=64632 RepID=UPI002301ED42|nr:uncharacterized protein BDF20DRAFT_835793 [Mycotypha africana]KAI8979832.1 hypothetical protein BDF20DRAFT_835793 [Mycotypha africana]
MAIQLVTSGRTIFRSSYNYELWSHLQKESSVTKLKNFSWSKLLQFIALMQNRNLKIGDAATQSGFFQLLAISSSLNGRKTVEQCCLGTSLPLNKLYEEHSEYLDNYVTNNPTCVVKDVTASLVEAFEDLTISDSAVYRHLTNKLAFTITRTQPRVANRNSEDSLEQRRRFVEELGERKVDYKDKCVFVDESGFLKNMVRPVAWSKRGTPAEVEVNAQRGHQL